MKNLITSVIAFCLFTTAYAQTTVYDSVYTGPGYAKQVYYSLANDSVGEAPMLTPEAWDLGFVTSLMDGSIIVNHVKGNLLYKVPNQDTTDWASIDTAGITGWTKLYNSDTSWSKGAFNINSNPGDPFDFGWGQYSFSAHSVLGKNEVYILKTQTGFKKLRIIIKNGATNVVKFRIANLDNSNDTLFSVPGDTYGTKNFVYYNIAGDSLIDIEPATTDWDILFTRYIFIPVQAGAPPVSGVLTNKGVKVAKATGNEVDSLDYNDFSGLLSSNISTIGYDWKAYTGGKYVLTDSLAYFIKTTNGKVFKLWFTGFGGGANGKYVFAKEEVTLNTGIAATGKTIAATTFPNPSADGKFNIVFSTTQNSDAAISVFDLSGRMVINKNVKVNDGLNIIPVETCNLTSGSYLVKVMQNGGMVNLKMIVAR